MAQLMEKMAQENAKAAAQVTPRPHTSALTYTWLCPRHTLLIALRPTVFLLMTGSEHPARGGAGAWGCEWADG